MASKGYLPKQEDKLSAFLSNYGLKIAIHGPTCGIPAPEVTDTQLWCKIAVAAIGLQNEVSQYAQGVTKFKNSILWATEAVAAWPNPYTLPSDLPASVKAGVVPLITLQVARIKHHTAYTTEIGNELGIEGPEQALPAAVELAAMKPLLKVRIESAGHPDVLWKKQGMDGVEIWVDRGDGKGFVFLAVDTIPNYLDTAALPAAGGTAVWKYKAIYRQHDQQVGQWSDEVKITVTGV